MKYTKILLVFFSILQNNNSYSQAILKNNSQLNFMSSFKKNITLEKLHHATKITFIPIFMTTFFIMYKENILKNVRNNPILASAGICFFINFIIDNFLNYKKITHILITFNHVKKIERYLIYAVAIKNTLQKIQTRNPNYYFKEQEYFNLLTKHTPLSFNELEELTFTMLNNISSTIEKLHIKIEYDIEANIYMLSKEHITLDDIQDLYKNDKEIYQDIKNFLQNSLNYYDTITTKLNYLITKQINCLLHCNK